MHLCARDCEYVPVCPWTTMRTSKRQKSYDEGKFPIEGLTVKKFILHDNNVDNVAYRVTGCPVYKRDRRSRNAAAVATLKKCSSENPKNHYRPWTDEELIKVAQMYGKYTHAEIAKELGRSRGSMYAVIKVLKERGLI